MKKSILAAVIIVSMLVSGCAGMCNPNGIGIAAGQGMQRGFTGIPGLALAGGELAACGAYIGISKLLENKPAAE